MPQQVPKISDINENIIAQLEASLESTIPLFAKSFSRVLAKALSAIFVVGYKFAGWIALQMFARYASYAPVSVNGQTFTPLIEWGQLIGVGLPTPATRAEALITVVVENQTGNLEAGSLLLRPSTGVIYSVVADVPLDNIEITAQVQAVNDEQGTLGFGTLGNLSVGDELQFVNPLPYVAGITTVSQVLVTAADRETETSYRDRVVTRFQRRPQGGARVDYQIWGELVEGIDLTLPYTGQPNQMILYSRSTTTGEDGIPTADQLASVKNSCEFDDDGMATRAPPGVLIVSNSISRIEVNVEIVGLGLTDGSAITLAQLIQQIEDAIKQHLSTLEPFIVGVSILPPRDRVSSAAIGGVIYTVAEANGAFFGSYSVVVGASPISTYVLEDGQLAKLGTLTT